MIATAELPQCAPAMKLSVVDERHLAVAAERGMGVALVRDRRDAGDRSRRRWPTCSRRRPRAATRLPSAPRWKIAMPGQVYSLPATIVCPSGLIGAVGERLDVAARDCSPSTPPSLTQLWKREAAVGRPARTRACRPAIGHVDVPAVRADADGVRTGHPGAARACRSRSRRCSPRRRPSGGAAPVAGSRSRTTRVLSAGRPARRASGRPARAPSGGRADGPRPARAAAGPPVADAARRAGGLGQRAGARVAEEDADHVGPV